MIAIINFFVLTLIINEQVFAGVIELNDSFGDTKGNDAWLVKFYAPWCGHCKKLEPIFHQVWLDLRNTDIKIAKVDATRYPSIGSYYDIRGYPSIKLIKGEKVYTYRGDRTKQSIVEFAKRTSGPAVRPIDTPKEFIDAQEELLNGVFFMFVGPKDASNSLYITYSQVAENNADRSYFFSGDEQTLPDEYRTSSKPVVLCFKDLDVLEFKAPVENEILQSALDTWINHERFTQFPEIAGATLNEMADLGKKIVMVIMDDNEEPNPQNEQLKEIVEHLIMDNKDALHINFQFAWMSESSTAESITLSTLSTPTIIVLDPDTRYHYIIPAESSEILEVTVSTFLQDILDGKIEELGGTGLKERFKRMYHDMAMTVYTVYSSSVWLALLIFGTPCLIIGIMICICCCFDTYDEEFDANYNENEHEFLTNDNETEDSEISEKKELEDAPCKEDLNHEKSE